MALKNRSQGRWLSRLHFLIRFLGLTGLVAAGVGAALAFLQQILAWDLLSQPEFVRSTIAGEKGSLPQQVAVSLLAGGLACAAFALLIELLGGLVTVAGRRSAFGTNALVQAVLALALLVGLNYYSFHHYRRFDLTTQKQFTLPADIKEQLGRLKDETTIVVYQRHKTFGRLTEKPDNYDYAAERKVVEKVGDLVEQFRELGPQFRVVVLDVEEEGYNDKLKALTENARELRDAIENAPENSIFFQAGKRVQRLSFNDFYQLDKTASQEANHGKGNLVLRFQGVEPFARKVLNVEEKRPKVAVAVVHGLLTTQGPEEYGLGGFKKALTARGFDVQDVILRKSLAPPEPAVATFDESLLDRLDDQLVRLDGQIKSIQADLPQLEKAYEQIKKASLDELSKQYAKQLRVPRITEQIRASILESIEEGEIAPRKLFLAQYQKDREATVQKKSTLKVENVAELRRMTDLRAKFERTLADCDLLVLPRMTIRNVYLGDIIPSRIYRLDDAQVRAIKEFMKKGKPVLACLGPINEPPDFELRAGRLGPAGPDGFEELLADLGFKLGKETVLFDVESGQAMTEQQPGLFLLDANVEVPPVEFERPRKEKTQGEKDNPIRQSMDLTARALGLGKSLELRLRHPRPIYFAPPPDRQQQTKFEPEFMLTNRAGWNEPQPFPSENSMPSPPKGADPTKAGKLDAGGREALDKKRYGQFPIGVAVETPVPTNWYESKDAKPATVRVAAIGHGGIFVGSELSPAKESLLVNTCNWLLGRDDLLPQPAQTWTFPRVEIPEREHTLWQWGTWLGLPGLCAYCGLVVVLARRLR